MVIVSLIAGWLILIHMFVLCNKEKTFKLAYNK